MHGPQHAQGATISPLGHRPSNSQEWWTEPPAHRSCLPFLGRHHPAMGLNWYRVVVGVLTIAAGIYGLIRRHRRIEAERPDFERKMDAGARSLVLRYYLKIGLAILLLILAILVMFGGMGESAFERLLYLSTLLGLVCVAYGPYGFWKRKTNGKRPNH